MDDVSAFIFNLTFNVLSIIVPVFATVYTVNKRIKAQTKENHQPHVVLKSIDTMESIDEYKYHYNLYSNNKDKVSLNIKITFKNIGYGVASNIKFYDLTSGKQIEGTIIKKDNINQRLFTTFDIASNKEDYINVKVYNDKEESHNILCIYKDLSEHVNSFIIVINFKSLNNYDYFAYQSTSLSYKKWYNKNTRVFRLIYKRYMD